MSKKKGNIPAYFTSPNERGESLTANTYTTRNNINHSAEVVYLKSDVYEHLSPLARKGADFLISENLMQVIDGEGAA